MPGPFHLTSYVMIITYIYKMKISRPNRKAKAAGQPSNRERILAAASQLFQEAGYQGLSISSICKRVGIAPTSLYWHFGDKAGLMRAVVENISAGHTSRLQEFVKAADGGPAKQLDLIVDGVRSLVLTQPSGALSFVAMLAQGATDDAALNEAMADARRRELDSIAEAFGAILGADEGRTAALTLLASVNYAALVYRVTHSEHDVDEILSAMKKAISAQAGLT